MPPPSPIVGRLMRAQTNFLETFPLMIAAVLIVSVGGPRNDTGPRSARCSGSAARVAYLPLYALGVPVLRSLAWTAATVGIFMVLWPALAAAF